MTTKKLSVLIIGGEASIDLNRPWAFDGPGTAISGGYVPRLIEQLQREGWQVHTESHAPLDLNVTLPLLQRLNLNRFDLVILQLGHSQLEMADTSRWPLGWIALLLGQIGLFRNVNAQLTDLLFYLQPFRRRLVMLTPLPHPQSVNQWLRNKGRDLFLKHGRRHMIPVFDTSVILGNGEEFFAQPTGDTLSPTAGDLLGQSLFDYIQVNALLPARPEQRQRRGY
ncbi:MAG: hypothetical protein EAZ91_21280 [Cytophagales bacterium]|nr:MAG: hypothetical protein EAZ91_21280 [Cytophagales bacterium]